jgi:hypothetical protein
MWPQAGHAGPSASISCSQRGQRIVASMDLLVRVAAVRGVQDVRRSAGPRGVGGHAMHNAFTSPLQDAVQTTPCNTVAM